MPPRPTGSRSSGWVVGRVAGAPVVVTPSWFLGAVVLTVVFAPTVNAFAPGLAGARVVLVSFAFVLLLFVSVFLHEVAHALVARSRGHQVTELAVTLWGGHTAYSGVVRRPMDAALVAVVGPLTNLVLAGLLWWAFQLQPVTNVPALLLFAGAFSNAFVGIFNLLPGLPLDGGQVLESLVWAVTGSRTKGTVAAGWIGRVVAVGLVAWALLWPVLEGAQPSFVTVAWSALIGAFLWSGAGAAIRGARHRERYEAVSVGPLAVPAVPVPTSLTVSALPGVAAGHPGAVVVVVDAGGGPIGWVDPQALASVPADQASATPIEAVVVPFPRGSAVDADLTGTALLEHLAGTSAGARIVAVVEHGRVSGVLDLARVAAATRQ